MSKNPPQPVTVASILAFLQAEQANEEFWHAAHVKAAGVLSKWVGKSLNKRLTKDLAAVLGEGTAYTIGFNGPEITVPNQPERAGGYIDRMGICYHSEAGNFQLEHFEKMDICHGTACAKRIAQRKALMEDVRTLQRIADRINGIRDSWESLKLLVDEYETPANVESCYFWRLTGLEARRN